MTVKFLSKFSRKKDGENESFFLALVGWNIWLAGANWKVCYWHKLFMWFKEPGPDEHISDSFRKACWGKEAL